MVKNSLQRLLAKTTRHVAGFFRFALKHPLLLGFSVFAAIELFVFVFRPDITLVARNTHILDEDLAVHQSLTDDGLLYALAPGKSATFDSVHPKETEFTTRTVSINNLGLRDTKPIRKVEKKPGVFRILVVGSSNTYGMLVDDPFTYPAQLEKTLQQQYPGKFEVLNAGIDAYALMQKTLWAKKLTEKLHPDLIIFQLGGYWGRRTFLVNHPKRQYLKNNMELLSENVPFLLSPSYNGSTLHNVLVRHVGTYRFALCLFNHMVLMYANTPKGQERLDDLSPKHSFTNYFEDLCANTAIRFAAKELEQFLDSPQTPQVVFFDPVPDIHTRKLASHFKDIPVIHLNVKRLPEEYSQIHPPSYGYTYYVTTIINWLRANKLLDAAKSGN